MSMTFLTKENCKMAEASNNKMENLPDQLRKCAKCFRNNINDENVVSVLDNSSDGNKIKNNMTKYCDSIDELASTLERLNKTISSLVLNSRRAIRTGEIHE